MNQKLRNFFSFFGKQGPRQMLMSAVIFLAIFSILPICGAESFPGTCAVTNNNDSGPGSLRQCVLDAENGSVITFSDDYIITLDSEIIIGKDLTVDAEGFAVTLQADAMPGVAGHGLLTVSEDAGVGSHSVGRDTDTGGLHGDREPRAAQLRLSGYRKHRDPHAHPLCSVRSCGREGGHREHRAVRSADGA